MLTRKPFKKRFSKKKFLYLILASLIRTVIGGAQIIDLMFLVIDAGKGMQTQTAECLILGEITCSTMIVVLNKIDTFPVEAREKGIEKVKKIHQSRLK